MEYIDPQLINSPRDFVRGVDVIFDGGADSYSVAKIQWEGGTKVAIRWNVARREWDDAEKISGRKRCVGMPSSHGYPVWFLIPDELLDRTHEIWDKICSK